jgi:hypothetical protein
MSHSRNPICRVLREKGLSAPMQACVLASTGNILAGTDPELANECRLEAQDVAFRIGMTHAEHDLRHATCENGGSDVPAAFSVYEELQKAYGDGYSLVMSKPMRAAA